MNKLILATMTLCLFALPSMAKDMTPSDIVSKVLENKQSFTGTKVQKTIRQNLKLEAVANVSYANKDNLNVLLKMPQGVSGINYAVNDGKSTIYFPYEKLSFSDALSSTGDMVTDTIISRISYELPLLQKNYNLILKPDDEILGSKTYVVKMVPKETRSKNYWLVPARTYWISKSNFQVLREDRSWGENYEAFFTSQYTDYESTSYMNPHKVKIRVPQNSKNVELSKKKDKVETYLESFKTPEEVEKKLKLKISTPSYLPDGFRMREIMVLNFYDTQIIIEKFDDGLNTIFVTYRSKPNIFLTLLAGGFSINLLNRMSDLSLNAPYNYASRDTKENLIISFGDLYPDDLKKVNDSVGVN